MRGISPGFTEYSQLISDNFSRAHNPKWPGGEFVGSTEGPGAMLSLPQSNPAAGTDFTITVPTGARWRWQALNFRLVTSATVATRIAEVVVQDVAGNVLHRIVPGASQAASLTVNYSLQNGVIFNSIDPAQVMVGIGAPVMLFAGWKIASSTTALQAGDQLSFITPTVEEWIEL
ncbi:MAG: hypothetical protein HRJ53_07440 [Acidobacteria bacterium Pan2503]|uniref:Uncharacterized protein n=1 Tax=Candidatus Acidiferrum panamense TaxID=2741543 RepID=A0A7V8SWE7_9BACT|nr:hypothetical protein [Candidatus Acidoferrum panamensis]